MIKITFDKKALSLALVSLGRDGVSSAASMAINRVLPGVRTDATRFLTGEVGVKTSKTVRNRMNIKKSSKRTLSGELRTLPEGLPLTKLKNVRVTKKRVSWRGETIKNAFRVSGTARKVKGEIMIGREGKKISRAFGYTLTQEYHKRETPDFLREKVYPRLNKEFNRAIAQELRKRGL